MLTLLQMRVATRPNPEINIGSVDLSCAFVVCDAERDDCPIVYCSDNFERLTGYTKHMILGRNCRFLQSPDGNVEPGKRRKYVDDDSVLYLKNMINLRRESQISLINYRRGGQPFMNLLTMIPIPWETEQTKFFVGFQVDLVEQPNAVTNKNPGTCSHRPMWLSMQADPLRLGDESRRVRAGTSLDLLTKTTANHLVLLSHDRMLTMAANRWLVCDQLPARCHHASIRHERTRRRAKDEPRPNSPA